MNIICVDGCKMPFVLATIGPRLTGCKKKNHIYGSIYILIHLFYFSVLRIQENK